MEKIPHQNNVVNINDAKCSEQKPVWIPGEKKQPAQELLLKWVACHDEKWLTADVVNICHYLFFRFGKNKKCWVLRETIMRELKLSKRRYYRALNAAEEHGLIKVKRRGLNLSNVFMPGEVFDAFL